jgi:serine-type D-Ala-D-Ala carboxypeptidase/endopeptidase (penicillin-binding protein 4)
VSFAERAWQDLPLTSTTARLALLAVLFGLWAGAPARAELPPDLARQLAPLGIPAAAVGLVVAPVAAGERYLAHQPDVPLQPASTMKLVTTLVGLEQLGPTWRGSTRLLATGLLRDGVLYGDLVLQGQGDMDLGWQELQQMLQHAYDRGVKDVRGALVLDRSAFKPTRLDVGVPPFDESPEFGYNVIPDALLVNGNLLRVELFVDERGLQVRPQVPLAGVRVTHEMSLFQGDCRQWDDGWVMPEVRPPRPGRKMDVVLRGRWPAGCDRAVEINVIERNDYIARLVQALWSRMGGRWRGPVREGVAPGDARLLAEHRSRPLSELVRAINKPSDNAFTRTLMLAIGRAAPGLDEEPTLQRADRAIRSWMRSKGIADAGLVLDNGSGLSRSERLTAAQLEGVVRAGINSRWAPEFLASLPIAGLDGTLRRRFVDNAAAGWARMKTGTLRNTVTLAGTLPDAAGQPLVMVVMINDDRVKPAQLRPVVDRLVDWVARTRFAPGQAPLTAVAPAAASAAATAASAP